MTTMRQNNHLTSQPGQNFFIFKVMLFLMLFSFTSSFAQTGWIKYEGNPVMVTGAAGAWDNRSVEGGTVILEGSVYHMWYGGYNGANYRIGHATSVDGIEWIKDLNNPVLDIGPFGSWDGVYVYCPCVVKVGTTFHMYYAGNDLGIECIGHATSQDGIAWTKDPLNPVMVVGPNGSWDELHVFPMAGSVIFDGSIFKMWYGGRNSADYWGIGYATSNDGSVWVKDEPHNPVLSCTLTGVWDSHGVFPCTVLFDGTKYQLWYNGCGFDVLSWRIGYATSPDGISWTRDTLNSPVLNWEPAGSWERKVLFDASVLYNADAKVYKMWYTGGMFEDNCAIGYATSPQTSIDEQAEVVPDSHFQLNCYRNPTGGMVDFRLSMVECRWITLKIYDVHGREVATVLDGRWPGDQVVRWDATGLPAGVYFYRLAVSGQRSTVGGKIFKY